MAHVVGFTGIEDNGQEGIELAADDRLAGTPGSRASVIKDRRGRIVEDVESVRAPQRRRGSRARDRPAHAVSSRYRELKAAVEAQPRQGRRASWSSTSKTGEVLALVNLPDLQPEQPRERHGPRRRATARSRISFEPGSTMKPFTVAAALETGIVKPDTVIQTGAGQP